MIRPRLRTGRNRPSDAVRLNSVAAKRTSWQRTIARWGGHSSISGSRTPDSGGVGTIGLLADKIAGFATRCIDDGVGVFVHDVDRATAPEPACRGREPERRLPVGRVRVRAQPLEGPPDHRLGPALGVELEPG